MRAKGLARRHKHPPGKHEVMRCIPSAKKKSHLNHEYDLYGESHEATAGHLRDDGSTAIPLCTCPNSSNLRREDQHAHHVIFLLYSMNYVVFEN